MRRYLNKGGIVLALFALATAGLVTLWSYKMVNAYGATARYCTKNCDPLLNNWGPEPSHDNVYELLYDYGGGLWLEYPQIHKKSDSIPMIVTYLTLPDGASITKNKVYLLPPNNGKVYKYVPYWSPTSPSLNPKQASSTTWRLRFRGLRNSPTAEWGFWIDWGTATSQCLKAVAHPMYYKRVKRDGHYVRVLKPIPHAPVQTGDYPSGCSQQ